MIPTFYDWWDWDKMMNLVQNINPVTSWWSPKFEFNFAGNRQIESRVVSDVASYGKQLGLISEALLEVAEGKQGEAVKKLEKMVEDIEKIKSEHGARFETRLQADLEYLKLIDKDAFDRVLSKYR